MRVKLIDKTNFKSQIFYDNETRRSWNKRSYWTDFVKEAQRRDDTAKLEDFLKNKITQNGDNNYLVLEEFKRKNKSKDGSLSYGDNSNNSLILNNK